MPECYLTIEAGSIVNKTTLQKTVSECKDGRYLVKIEKKNKRSLQQNSYIHAVLFPELAKAFTEAGYDGVTSIIAKHVAKKMFLTRQIVNHETGEVKEYIKDTSDCSTTEINIFIDEVIRFAVINLNYEIPYPNEQMRIDL